MANVVQHPVLVDVHSTVPALLEPAHLRAEAWLAHFMTTRKLCNQVVLASCARVEAHCLVRAIPLILAFVQKV